MFDTIINKKKIKKGWSLDEKYKVTTHTGEHFLLRVSSRDQAIKREQEFSNMMKVFEAGITICKPVAIQVNDNVEVLHEWIHGRDLNDVIKEYSSQKQYEIGVVAGKILKEIHSISVDDNHHFDWSTRFNKKVDVRIDNYENCPLNYKHGPQFLSYLNNHRHLLENRPICFQHGDYHSGNMMIDEEGDLVIIDFDRSDYGDPYEEFNRIVWSTAASTKFASGILDGYFEGVVPELFWKLLKFYIIANTISALPWGLKYDPDHVSVYQDQAQQVYEWYDGLKSDIPVWYQGGGYGTIS